MAKAASIRPFDPGAGVVETQNLLHALALPGHALRAVLAESDAVPEAAPGDDHLRDVEGEGGVAAVDALGPGDRGQAAAAGPVARHAKPLRGEGPPCAVGVEDLVLRGPAADVVRRGGGAREGLELPHA